MTLNVSLFLGGLDSSHWSLPQINIEVHRSSGTRTTAIITDRVKLLFGGITAPSRILGVALASSQEAKFLKANKRD